MGTNFYLERRPLCVDHPDCREDVELAATCFADRVAACPCKHLHESPEQLHIGKSSMGWCFALHVTEKIKNLDDWKRLFADPAWRIVDEYGEELPVSEMLERIVNRPGREVAPSPGGPYTSWADFLSSNYAWLDPCGLLRHAPTPYGRRPVNATDGTYDLIEGEFS